MVGLTAVRSELMAKTGTIASSTVMTSVSQNNAVDASTLTVAWYSGSSDQTSDISRWLKTKKRMQLPHTEI